MIFTTINFLWMNLTSLIFITFLDDSAANHPFIRSQYIWTEHNTNHRHSLYLSSSRSFIYALCDVQCCEYVCILLLLLFYLSSMVLTSMQTLYIITHTHTYTHACMWDDFYLELLQFWNCNKLNINLCIFHI